MSGSENSQANEPAARSGNQDNTRDQAAAEHRLSLARERAEAARAAAAKEQEKEAEMSQERDRGARER